MVLIPVAKSKTTHLGRITAEALACAVRLLEGGGVSAIAPPSVRAFAGTPAPLMASIAPATPPVMRRRSSLLLSQRGIRNRQERAEESESDKRE